MFITFTLGSNPAKVMLGGSCIDLFVCRTSEKERQKGKTAVTVETKCNAFQSCQSPFKKVLLLWEFVKLGALLFTRRMERFYQSF